MFVMHRYFLDKPPIICCKIPHTSLQRDTHKFSFYRFSKKNVSYLQYCLAELAEVFPDESCSCPMDVGSMDKRDFVSINESLPFMTLFNVSDLSPHTEYCVQSIGDYGTEITRGLGSVVMTESKSGGSWGV